MVLNFLSSLVSITNSFSKVLMVFLIEVWHISINLCAEDQTLTVKTQVYVFETCEGLLHSCLIAIPLIETPDFPKLPL